MQMAELGGPTVITHGRFCFLYPRSTARQPRVRVHHFSCIHLRRLLTRGHPCSALSRDNSFLDRSSRLRTKAQRERRRSEAKRGEEAHGVDLTAKQSLRNLAEHGRPVGRLTLRHISKTSKLNHTPDRALCMSSWTHTMLMIPLPQGW